MASAAVLHQEPVPEYKRVSNYKVTRPLDLDHKNQIFPISVDLESFLILFVARTVFHDHFFGEGVDSDQDAVEDSYQFSKLEEFHHSFCSCFVANSDSNAAEHEGTEKSEGVDFCDGL